MTFGLVNPVQADEQTRLHNIYQGNWNVGGSFSISRESDTETTRFNLSSEAKYFFADRFALGASTRLATASGADPLFAIGPDATYFFCTHDQWATYVSAGVRFGITDASWKSVITTQLGAAYFITPSVAFGPSFYFDRYTGSFTSFSNYGLLFNFGIFI